MVVVNFLVEFSDRNSVSVPVGISDSRSEKGHPPLTEFVKRLKEKCAIRGPVELRNKNGSKVDFEKWNPSASSSFYALADEEASQTALDYRETMRRTIRSNSRIVANSSSASTNGNPLKESDSSSNSFIKVQTTNNGTTSDKTGVYVAKHDSSSSSRVEVLDDELKQPQNSNNQAEQNDDDSTSEDDDDYDPKGGEHVFSPDAIHFISHGEGKGFTTISKVASEYGKIICQELPELSPMYPSSLVDLIRRNPKMKVWLPLLDKKSKSIEKMESALPGVDSDDYSNLLYIAKRRGHTVPAKKDEETQVAFYPFIDSLTHSCAPSAVVRFKKASNNDPEKHRAILRCVSWNGLQAGDLLSIALTKVSTMDFFLLPTSRRRKFIQEQYSLKDECRCARCTGRISVSQSEVDESLTGAFFLPKGASVSSRDQTRLSLEMKNEFDSLKIMAKATRQSTEPLVLTRDAKNGKIPAETVSKLYDFLKKYTHGLVLPKSQQHQETENKEGNSNNNKDQQQEEEISLKLHVNHWRLSMCRIALLAYLFPPSNQIPKIGSKKPENLPTRHPSVKLDQLVVRFALAQLDVESAVLAKHAESAHPALKRSYVVFRLILCCLPEQLSAQVQKDARSLKNVDWPMVEKVSNELALSVGVL